MKLTLSAALLLSATSTAALAQRDAYGNRLPDDVVRYQRDKEREQAREEAYRAAARERRIIPGMTEFDVRNILGEPYRINDNGGHVQWVYQFTYGPDGTRRAGNTYVYFRNGKTY
jgi:outer membrane protein assembly factor BamE (lipoprotein component of BamABCDE complex)